MDVLLQILMWLTLAFLAGFIGQFGKSLTLRLLERRKARAAAAASPAVEPALELERSRHKLEKKLAKQELKRRKKAGDAAPRERNAPPPRAAVDIGSNSIKIVLARSAEELDAPLLDAVRICGLGAGLVETGRLSEAAMARALDKLAELVSMARERGAEEFAAVGTKALRSAGNTADFQAAAQKRCGLDVEVIDGLEEAVLSFRASSSTLAADSASSLHFDVGGGSTEFILGAGARPVDRFSLDLGCLSLSERFHRRDPPAPADLQAMATMLAGELEGRLPGAEQLVGIGGTVTSLGTVELGLAEWRPASLQGLVLTEARVRSLLDRFAALPLAERALIPGLMAERAPVIVAGTALVLAVLRASGQDALRLSPRALRHGLWLDRWGN